MGHAIETLAPSRNHEIIVTIDNPTEWQQRIDLLRQADVAIDFSQPDVAVENIRKCFDINMPIVVGTTGWYDHLDAIVEECRAKGQSLFVASNFSIGMNIMFDLNRRLAHLMNRYDYAVAISETHHVHKLDAPSGTAITLARDIIGQLDSKDSWHLAAEIWPDGTRQASACAATAVPITSIREGEVPGIHEVVYDNAIDTITLRHSAKSRTGLAQGAILAAEYLIQNKGYHTMQDLLAE